MKKHLHKKKKHPLTLLEIMIAFVLLGILLTSLFQFYHQAIVSKVDMKKKKDLVLSRAYFTTCLQRNLSLVSPTSFKDKSHISPLYTKEYEKSLGKALFFHTFSSIDEDPGFFGELTSVLYLSSSKDVEFVTSSKIGSAKKEILLRNVQSIEFWFYDTEKEDWVKNWSLDAKKLPSMIKCAIHEVGVLKEDEKEEFVFFLPLTQKEILYQE